MIHPLALLADERARPLVPYEWSWSLHPSVLIGTGLLGALYVWGIGPLRRRRQLGPPVPAVRCASFAAALLVLLVSLNGPMHDLSDYYLFSVHMVQHLLLTLVFPPLLIYGTPGWLLRPLLRPPMVLAVARFVTRPLVAGVIFAVTLAVWHLTPCYELMMREHEVHIITHLLFMVAATIMWWPVMSPLPELPRLPYGLGMLYLFLVGIPMQVVAALITTSDQVLYPWYSVAPRTWGLSPLDDQQLGGLLMWVPGNLYMFLAIGVLFFCWARESEAGEGRKAQGGAGGD
jgi:putative membrane protein